MKKKFLLSTITAALFISGCSSIMPYDSEFSCNKGPGQGICGSMTEIYQKTLPKDGNGSVNGKDSKGGNIAIDSDQEEVMYALYRKEKVDSTKNKQQDDRLARLELQSKLLIANNANLASKIADIPTAPIVQNYPIYDPKAVALNKAEASKVDTGALFKKKPIKKKKRVKTCHNGDFCKIAPHVTTVNAREGACGCSDITGSYIAGESFKVDSEKNGWVKTDKGWVDSALLVKTKIIPKKEEKVKVDSSKSKNITASPMPQVVNKAATTTKAQPVVPKVAK